MLQRDIPDWEGFEFGIACADPSLVFMVKLRKAGSHFSASRARCSNDYQWPGGLNIIILSVTLVTYNQGSIAGIAWDIVKGIYFDAQFLKAFFKGVGTVLSRIAGDADTSHI